MTSVELEIRQVQVLHFIARAEISCVVGIVKFRSKGRLHFADVLKVDGVEKIHHFALICVGSL